MMRSTGRALLRFALAALVVALASAPRTSFADGKAKAVPAVQPAFCAPELEAITPSGNVCYLDGGRTPARRTLVIFLHGAIAKNTTWSWNHERMLMKLARAAKIEVLFPRSPETDVGFVWPGTLEAQERVEQSLFDEWNEAKHALEQRDGRPFDEVFVMGFSSGAYFASSLAMRGRFDTDGYAVFAGGQPMARPAAPVVHWSPVFVGVCADDETTAAHSRAFAGSLSAAGIPRAVLEQHVGHGLSHVHFNGALGYLRRMKQSLALSHGR
jgi:predicted esterase